MRISLIILLAALVAVLGISLTGCSSGGSAQNPVDVTSGCQNCHDSVQDNEDGIPLGGRRAVMGEFPVSDAHAHYGASTDDASCKLCHDMGGHESGFERLLDADNGSLYSFVNSADLTSDPDLSDFCMSCHDSDGAQRLASPSDPFGGGNAPTNIANRFMGTLQWREWYGDFCFGNEGTTRPVNSHHDISDADQAFSGARVECLDCHGAHSSGSTQRIADPADTTKVWAGTTNDFCIACHKGGSDPALAELVDSVKAPMVRIDSSGFPCDAGGDCGIINSLVSGLRPLESCEYTSIPWYTSYIWKHSAHGGNSKRGWEGYSGAPSAELDCVVCHDPHGSYSASNPEGNPYMIRDFVNGTAYVDDGRREGPLWTGPPWDTMGTAREVIVTVAEGANPPPSGTDASTVDWGGATGLCSVCHSDWVAAFSFQHEFCSACQTCHGHGQDYNENDWGTGPVNSTSCGKCGNSVIDVPEECDDGNKVDGDGCSSECLVE